MTGSDPSPKSRRALLWLFLGALVISLVLRIARATDSFVIGVAATAAIALALVPLGIWGKRRDAAKVDEAIEGDGLRLDLQLEITSLPDRWARMAADLSPTRTTSIYGTLTTSGQRLTFEKRTGFWWGRTPFRVEVDLTEITDVTVARAATSLAGRTLTVRLRSAESPRFVVGVNDEKAEQLADRLRTLARCAADHATGITAVSTGLRITAPAPPPRIPHRTATLISTAPILPMVLGLVGVDGSPVAVVVGLLSFVTAMTLSPWRRPWLPGWVAITLAFTAIAFVADTVIAGEPWRLLGTALSFGLAALVYRARPLRRDEAGTV